MMVWSLTAMLSSIKEFWRVVDNIDGPFQFDSVSGSCGHPHRGSTLVGITPNMVDFIKC